MMEPVIVYGVGQLGRVFGSAWLSAGRPVIPVTRSVSAEEVAQWYPNPALVLISVAEDDLEPVLSSLPACWRGRVALLQNELTLRHWEAHLDDPTVAIVWFEKKKRALLRQLRPTLLFGPHSAILAEACARIPVDFELPAAEERNFELALKNIFILLTNIAGIVMNGGTTGMLWTKHRYLAEDLLTDLLNLQENLLGEPLPRARLHEALGHALLADPDHNCLGRHAPARLRRALEHAERRFLQVPRLRAVARERALAELVH